MPLYEYECRDHGVFERTRSMLESGSAADCPLCSAAAPRILSAPALRSTPASTRIAHERNERSRYEPRLVQKAAHTAAPGASASRGRPWMMSGCG